MGFLAWVPTCSEPELFEKLKRAGLPFFRGQSGIGGRPSPAQDEGDVDEGGEVGKELQREELDGELALLLRQGPGLLWNET